MAVDRFAAVHGLSFTRQKFKARIAAGTVAGQEAMLAKPQTFMNLSGEAVGPLVRFYNRPLDDLLVVYDDIDIPFGTIRMRRSGSSGGHKGMKSIIAHLGSDEFPRLRVGIRGLPPPENLTEYVLQRFTKEEATALDDIIEQACNAIEVALTGDLEKAMAQFN
jgi:PTH1 family peptidyl-tRNA hydrolase